MAIGRKIVRTLQDEGALSTLQKICSAIVRPVFSQIEYRVYRIRLPAPAQWTSPHATNFQLSVLSPNDTSSREQIEQQAEWLRGVFQEKLMAGTMCVIASDLDRVVGFNLVSFGDVHIPILETSRHFREREAWSDSIYVHKDYRGHGLAVALRDKVFQELHNRGIRKLYGGTVPSNKSSLRLATKAGFTPFASVRYRRLLQRRSWRVQRFRACAERSL